MKTASWIILLYGIVIFLGGLMGHIKAASTASLIMGSSFGILLVISSFGMFRDRLLPAYLALIMTLVLDSFFTYRWLYTFKFFPAGFMALISLGVLVSVVLLVRRHLNR